MRKSVMFLSLLITFVVAEELIADSGNNKDMSRRKKFKFAHHGLWHLWGFHTLAILYWVKVKVIIVSFFIGTAIVWAVRSFWYHYKSCPEITHGGPIISYDHGIHDHMDHVPYSSYSDVHFDHDPYGGHNSYSDSQLDIIGNIKSHPQRKTWKGRQATITENEISEMVFMFLGVGSDACRKRFLCELEFKSQRHPLTRMAFRIFGHGIFSKYTRKANDDNEPKSFEDCSKVHHKCEYIEENIRDEREEIKNSEINIQSKAEEEDVVTFSSVSKHRRKLRSRRKVLMSSTI